MKEYNAINTNRNLPQKNLTDRAIYIFLITIATILFLLAFTFNTPKEILDGNVTILISPANLLTDYFALTNIGAALVNASLMAFLTIGMIKATKTKFTGVLIAAFFTVIGFSLFGKNLYNSISIIAGVSLYSRVSKTHIRTNLPVALFGTALGPMVSEFSFNLDLPIQLGIIIGNLVGVLIGFIIPVLSSHFVKFYRGYNLYNIGFTCGIIGTFFIGILRSFGVEVKTVSLVSSGNNLEFAVLLYSFFIALFVLGLIYNNWNFKGFSKILKEVGNLTPDFIKIAGFGPTLINMSMLGALATTYVLLVGGEINGPVLGGIFTVVGFGACGKHIKNVTPILFSIFIIGIFHLEEVYSPVALLAALFGTTLAPISGRFGPLAGMLAGALHMTLTVNVVDLHAGMNLYNNGFSGGLVAATLYPLLNAIMPHKKDIDEI